jgi:hypothetical protein
MMIDQVGEGNRLTIGEGVETTLAALEAAWKGSGRLRRGKFQQCLGRWGSAKVLTVIGVECSELACASFVK